MKIYNTLSRKIEDFIPINDKTVTFYHCGPTVYWIQHIGNMRAVVIADLIRRSFEFCGYKVIHTRNYTDVGHLTGDNIGDADTGEDRMSKASKREGISPDEIALKYITLYEEHVRKLNTLKPTYTPRATEYISQMIDLVQTLVDKGYAYSTDLAIYFDITKFSKYNQLNKQKLDLNLAGLGSGEITDSQKKHAYDFSLWFFKAGVHNNALQFWKSPFKSRLVKDGEGFPGWHIECSAMSKSLLGNTIDLHMGGVEHISIHHTNEIAQSECANGVKFVNYWIHNAHLLVNNRKMSKSEGTGFSLDEIIDKGYHPLDLRYFFLQSHYRTTQNFTFEAIENAKISRLKILNWINKTVIEMIKNNQLITSANKNSSFYIDFIKHIKSDFDIPQALAVMWNTLKSSLSDNEKLSLMLEFDKVFAIGITELHQKLKTLTPIKISSIENLIIERNICRQNKEWNKADEIRDSLLKEDIQLLDSKDNTEWRLEI